MENLQLRPRGIVLVPAKKRKRFPKPNNSRREIESEAEYYDSEGNYTSLVWDNPITLEDILVEMVSTTKDTEVAPEEDPVMLIDSGESDKETRRGESNSNKPTQGSSKKQEEWHITR